GTGLVPVNQFSALQANFFNANLQSIEQLEFLEGDKTVAGFVFGQLGAPGTAPLSSDLHIKGSSHADTIAFYVVTAGAYSLAGTNFTFENWDNGQNGTEETFENFIRATDYINLTVATTPTSGGNYQLTGSAGRDSLNGNAGDDTLIGGAGDDIL